MKELLCFCILTGSLAAQQDTILLFISAEQTYYSEYVVMKKGLEAAGYAVDVRSARSDSASIYMVPSNTDIEEIANTLAGSSYAQFTAQFQNLFGAAWNSAWNAMPSYAPVQGRIQDVTDISRYAAMVIAGGTGALDYRVDGSYAAQGSGLRELSAGTVQAAAESLNALALSFLLAGKPVMAQCHASSLPVFWRIPGTSGPGEEVLGYSLLKDQPAAGFPEPATAVTLAAMDVVYREQDRVTVATPHNAFVDNGMGDHLLVTTRDWYPQTIAHAARTLVNMLQTFPTALERGESVSVLILHGGPVNVSDCSYLNRSNDIPCNYGTGGNIPADYTDLTTLFAADSPNDTYSFTVTHLNMTGEGLPYSASDASSVADYLDQFDVVLFFKHWSTGLTEAFQQGMVTYADNGGGVIALHHGLYNDVDGSVSKDILVEQLFGAGSAMNTWSGNLTSYNAVVTDHGHFISTFGISYPEPVLAPSPWSTNALPSAANATGSYYQRIPVYDEIYNNMTFAAGQSFGRGINQITPLFSNDQDPSGQSHTTGFIKQFDPSLNGSVGKVAYFQIGERKENLSVSHLYGQVLRNTAVWMGASSTTLPVELVSFTAVRTENGTLLRWSTATEQNNLGFEIQRSGSVDRSLNAESGPWNTIGFVEGNGYSNIPHEYRFNDRSVRAGTFHYRLKQIDRDGRFEYSPLVQVTTAAPLRFTLDQNHPNPFNPTTALSYQLTVLGRATLIIYDAIGREMSVLVNEEKEAGSYSVQFDASKLASGIYFARLTANGKTQIRKMILMK